LYMDCNIKMNILRTAIICFYALLDKTHTSLPRNLFKKLNINLMRLKAMSPLSVEYSIIPINS